MHGKNVTTFQLAKKRHTTDIEFEIFHNVLCIRKISLGMLKLNSVDNVNLCE